MKFFTDSTRERQTERPFPYGHLGALTGITRAAAWQLFRSEASEIWTVIGFSSSFGRKLGFRASTWWAVVAVVVPGVGWLVGCRHTLSGGRRADDGKVPEEGDQGDERRSNVE